MGKKGEVVVWSLPPFFPFLRAATVELLLWWRLRWSGGEKRWRGDRNKVAAPRYRGGGGETNGRWRRSLSQGMVSIWLAEEGERTFLVGRREGRSRRKIPSPKRVKGNAQWERGNDCRKKAGIRCRAGCIILRQGDLIFFPCHLLSRHTAAKKPPRV